MKNLTLCAIVTALLFLFGGTANAQAAHSANLAWGASPTSGANYHVKRAPCTGTVTSGTCSVTPAQTAFTTVASVTTLTFSDTSVSAGASYVYEVTAFCPATGCPTGVTGESVPSNMVAAVIPTDVPGAPTNLTIPSVTMDFAPYLNEAGARG